MTVLASQNWQIKIMEDVVCKELSEMTLEELWELFPIFLVEHREKWNDDYKEIKSELQQLLSDCHSPRINHVGSTALSGIWAKNIVDVLVEFPKSEDIENVAEIMSRNGLESIHPVDFDTATGILMAPASKTTVGNPSLYDGNTNTSINI